MRENQKLEDAGCWNKHEQRVSIPFLIVECMHASDYMKPPVESEGWSVVSWGQEGRALPGSPNKKTWNHLCDCILIICCILECDVASWFIAGCSMSTCFPQLPMKWAPKAELQWGCVGVGMDQWPVLPPKLLLRTAIGSLKCSKRKSSVSAWSWNNHYFHRAIMTSNLFQPKYIRDIFFVLT